MRLAILFLFFSNGIWARPLVLLAYFDAFGSNIINNSETVARKLQHKTVGHPEFEIRLCALNTVFDRSLVQLETCFKSLPTQPALILGIGEFNCRLKIETIVRNLDHTYGPDNEGNERESTVIISDAPEFQGLHYPLPQMYCSLSKKERLKIQVSNNSGTFVCNNLAFQFSWRNPEIAFGFIHVPAHFCKNLKTLTETSIKNLEIMIKTAVKARHFSRLAIFKRELSILRSEAKNQCLKEFYKRTKGVDEKGLWTF